MIMNEDACFQRAAEFLLSHEGGYVDHPDDPGGATNYGVSLRFLRKYGEFDGDIDEDGDIDAEDISQMSREQAKQIYYTAWWQKYSYGEFHLILARHLLDKAVLFGPRTAHRMLQRACRAGYYNIELTEDGILGPKTRSAIKKYHDGEAIEQLVSAFKAECAGHARLLAAVNKDLSAFKRGWLNRIYDEGGRNV